MPAHNAAWYDAQYNNRAMVPDFADHLAHWASASAAARAQGGALLDLPYGSGPGMTLDVFEPPRPNAPVAVFIHGGYWRALDKSDFSFVAPALRAQGACTVVVNYGLCPGTPAQPIGIADIALQMTQALAHVWRHARDWGGDPGRIRVLGHSAGGHLAAMLQACDWRAVDPALPADLVPRALSISGLFDLRSLLDAAFLQTDLRLDMAQARRVSPALWPAPSRGQLLAVVGGDESAEFQRQNRLIRRAWGAAHVPVCQSLPGLNHFSIMSGLSDPASPMHGLLAKLLQDA